MNVSPDTWAVLIMFGIILVIQQVNHVIERRRLDKIISDLQNRLMARDLTEYAGVTRGLNKRPGKPVKEVLTEEEKAEKERALDRIPIN